MSITVNDLVAKLLESGKSMTAAQINQIVSEARSKFGLSGHACDTLALLLIAGKPEAK